MTATTRDAAPQRAHKESCPDSLKIQPTKTSLEKLPRELRDQIYFHALVSFSPIHVSKLKCVQEYRNVIKTWFEKERGATSSSLEGLSVDLMRTNRQIAHEAAEIFYGKNHFAFHGHRDWSVAVDWLRTIGEENRRRLTHVELDVRQLTRVWQNSDGTRESLEPNEPINSRHPLLQSPSGDGRWPVGEVDDIDPKMEDVFSALADCEWGARLMLSLRYVGLGYPGFFVDDEDFGDRSGDLYFSMDLPNLIEIWRFKHGSNAKKRTIEVIWSMCGDNFEDETRQESVKSQLEDHGWQILGFEPHSETVECVVYPGQFYDQHGNKITMKRKPLSGPLIHSEPNRYSPMIPEKERAAIYG